MDDAGAIDQDVDRPGLVDQARDGDRIEHVEGLRLQARDPAQFGELGLVDVGGDDARARCRQPLG